MFSNFNRSKLLNIIGAVGLVLYGFFVAQIVILFLIRALVEAGVVAESSLQSTLVQFTASVLAYVLALFIILGTFTAIKNSMKGLKDVLAIKKRPTWGIIYYIFIGYGVYFVLSFVLISLAQVVIPGFNVEQKQDVGFGELSGQFEYIMAFFVLIVVAPIVEEMIFRGFLFSRLRKSINFWWTALLVSLVFGLVHMQWNVGVDVFAMSLILCYIREKTGSIWAGVGVHMLKNSLAFIVIFLQFDIEKAILRLLY